MKRRGFLTKLGLGFLVAPTIAKSAIRTHIPTTPKELESAINSLFINRGSYDRAYIMQGRTPIVFETYVNGWIKAEGDKWIPSKPEMAISRMWESAVAEYKSGKRSVWWRMPPSIGPDNETSEREVLRMRLKFT